MKMPFGKHLGVELAAVPRPYLRWLKGQPWLGAWLVKEIDLVLDGEAVGSPGESFEEVLKAWKEEENG